MKSGGSVWGEGSRSIFSWLKNCAWLYVVPLSFKVHCCWGKKDWSNAGVRFHADIAAF